MPPTQAGMAAPLPRRAGDRSGTIGFGITDSPDSFLLAGQLDFWQTEHFALGPMLQLGLDDDVKIVAPSLHVKHEIPIPATPHLVPFAQGGVGLLWMSRDRPRDDDDDDVGFMVQFGVGLEWRPDDHLSFGSSLMLDVLPWDVLDENAILTWQIAQVGVRF